MAKVRIQARSADVEDALEHDEKPPQTHKYHHKHGKHVGALDILARVWKREGFTGWYQVGVSAQRQHIALNLINCIGNGSPDHKSSSIASVTFHVERTI